MKIAIVGAGSKSFGAGTIRDILLSDTLTKGGVDITLMDIVPQHLEANLSYARRLADHLGREARVTGTTDLDAALDGAGAVVTAIEVNRYFYWAQDFHIPRKHGFNQIYGENGGPGGLFHALRNMGPTLRVARRMEQLCPKALLLNFTNPEAKLCEAITRQTQIQTLGLCHGVFGGQHQIATFLGMPEEELEMSACGINHFTWFQTVKSSKTGEDLYPLLKARERQADPLAQWDEHALSRACLRVFGLWPSPGTNHIGEYIRWADELFAAQKMQYFYDPADGNPWETGMIPRFVYSLGGHPADVPLFPEAAAPAPPPEALPDKEALRPSRELCVPIIEALLFGVPHELAAVNTPNRGAIPGLPDETVVEVPADADAKGLRPWRMPALPEAVLAMIRTQASIQQLLVEAFVEASRRKLLQAVLLDPTVNSYHNAVSMINEMCELQKDLLPPLKW